MENNTKEYEKNYKLMLLDKKYFKDFFDECYSSLEEAIKDYMQCGFKNNAYYSRKEFTENGALDFLEELEKIESI